MLAQLCVGEKKTYKYAPKVIIGKRKKPHCALENKYVSQLKTQCRQKVQCKMQAKHKM